MRSSILVSLPSALAHSTCLINVCCRDSDDGGERGGREVEVVISL